MEDAVRAAVAVVKDEVLWRLVCHRARRAGIDPSTLERVREHLRISTKRVEPRYAHPAQRPEHYFPGLSARPWHDPADHPWTGTLSAAHGILVEELEGVRERLERQPAPLTDDGAWDVYYLHFMGRRVEENWRRCPGTARVLESLRGLRGVGHAYFSLLHPGTHIKPHCGPINVWLRCHLGLVVPPGCRIRVDTESREWAEGECLVFDDAFEHEVWNPSDEERAVLVVDFWHPELSSAEAWALGQILRMSARVRRRDRSVAARRGDR